MTKSIRKRVRKLRQKNDSQHAQSPSYWPRRKRDDARKRDELRRG